MARRRSGRRGYDNRERVGELIRRVLADELIEIDDERLSLLTISGVDVDRELSVARVHWSSYEADDESVKAALADHRGALRKAVADRTRLRRAPRLEFEPDSGIRGGARIEAILAGLDPDAPNEPDDGDEPKRADA